MTKALIVTLGTSILLITGCQATKPFTKKDAEMTSTGALCSAAYARSTGLQEKQIISDELKARGIDWRSVGCEQVANDRYDRRQRNADAMIEQGRALLDGKGFGSY